MGLFNMLAGWQTTLIAVGVVGAVGLSSGTYLGYSYRDARCVATIDQAALNAANARVHALEVNIATMQVALDADAALAAQDKVKLEELERTTDDLRTKTSSGVCLPADDIEQLRQWWRGGAPANAPSRRGAK